MIVNTILKADLFIKKNIGTEEQVTKLISELWRCKDESVTTDFTNTGCWRAVNPDVKIDWLLIEIKELLECAKKEYGISKNSENFFCWANINDPGSRNVFHSHKSSVFSCVYYVQGTGTGDLRFTNPANMLGECNQDSPYTKDIHFRPHDGDLILWPSWMPHEVETNFSSKPRINLAFDIVFKN